jgi:hypothetical protein
MSTNLATILVGLGYDLSALEKGSPEAFRLINEQTLNMSAQMKRNAREGAEAFRSIDEMIGIHINRPMTRLLVETFPSFGKALSDVLGGVAFGAVAFAGYEVFERISQAIEKATKAQEALREATANTNKVFAEEMAAYEHKDKAITAAATAVDRLAEAEMKQAKAAEEASGWFNKSLASVGSFTHQIGSFQSTLNLEAIGKRFSEFVQDYNTKALSDSIHGTANASKMLADELARASAEAQKLNGLAANHAWYQPGSGFDTSAKAMGEYVGYLTRLQQVQNYTSTAVHDEQAKAAAIEAQKEAIREVQGDLKRWNDAADEFWKTWMKDNEVLDQMLPKVGGLASEFARMQEAQKVFFPAIGQTAAPALVGAPKLADVLELQKVTTDQNEAWKKAGEVLAQIETPLQKYQTGLAILQQLEKEGRISTTQFAAAQQLLQEQMQQNEDRMEQLLKKSSISGGMQAFWLQLQGKGAGQGSAEETFQLLNSSMEGFVDETAKALTGAQVKWQQFFEGIDQMVLKLLLNRVFASLLTGPLGGLGNLFGLSGGGGSSFAPSAFSFAGAFTGFAGGTDYAPGGLSWVGENGPELLNLPTGSSVTPASMLRGGGAPIINIDARGAELGVEDKIARALAEWTPHVVTRSVAEASEVQRRSLSR